MRYLSWPEVERLGQILTAEKGTHEESGPNVGTCAKYQKVTGNDPGSSWCLSFIMWGLLQLLGTRAAVLDCIGKITGGCADLLAANEGRALMPIGTAPIEGDIGLVVRNSDNHAHHAFYIGSGPGEDGSYWTIEGNSNDTGGSNGDGVYTREKRFGINDPGRDGGGGSNHYRILRIQKLDQN
jgi:hypothetical protein